MKQKPGEFSKKVIELALTIPPGRVTTYGLLCAAAGGHPMLSRMITHILGKCPIYKKQRPKVVASTSYLELS